MKRFIPTYEQCVEICKSNDVIFYETKHQVDGYDISIFNYRLSSYNDFINPVPGKDWDARELRGYTFVFNKDGSLCRRYLLMDKFWNLNQVPETQYDIVKNKKIVRVTNKEDGSLLTFIELPNGKIITKTKAGLDNEQTVLVNDLISKNETLSKFVKYCLDLDVIPMFEFVSFRNRIVLNYSEEKLILIKVRDNKTGKYINLEEFVKNSRFDIEIVPSENFTSLDEMIKLSETIIDKEGWVVEFEDGQMIKIKSLWYFIHHQLLTEKLNQENAIIQLILDEQIDDMYAQLDEKRDTQKIEWINNIQSIVLKYIDKTRKEVLELVSKYEGDLTKSKEDNKDFIKKFAILYNKEPLFGIAISFISGKDLMRSIVDMTKRKTNHLEEARNFLIKNQ